MVRERGSLSQGEGKEKRSSIPELKKPRKIGRTGQIPVSPSPLPLKTPAFAAPSLTASLTMERFPFSPCPVGLTQKSKITMENEVQ